jgi:hypothetical protein
MRQGNSSRERFSRFRILELLSATDGALTCSELAKRSGQAGFWTRSFRASLATRLRRLRRWGLVWRHRERWGRPARSRRAGIYRWRISRRRLARLGWAKEKGLL